MCRLHIILRIFFLSQGSCDPSNIRDQFYVTWFFVLAFYTVDLTLYCVTFQSTENSDGFKHMQIISNLSPFVYYLSHFLFDYLTFIGNVLGRIVSFQMTDHSYHFLAINYNLGKRAIYRRILTFQNRQPDMQF